MLSKVANVDLSPAFPAIMQIVRNSIITNFRTGGRFGSGMFDGGAQKWKPSGRAGKQSGQTLRDRGILMNSIWVKIEQKGGKILITAGSNQPYAAAHQYGVNKTVTVREHTRLRKNQRGSIVKRRKDGRPTKKLLAQGISINTVQSHSRKMNLPARPFMVLQDSDIATIQARLQTEFYKQMRR